MPRPSPAAGALLLHAVLSARALMQREVPGSSPKYGLLEVSGSSSLVDGGESPLYGTAVTGSVEERATMWQETFEKVFTVQLNMSKAREAGMPLGIKVDVKSEFEPLGVQMVRCSGLAQEDGAVGAEPQKDGAVGAEPQKAAEGLRLLLQRASEGVRAEAADSEGAEEGVAAEGQSAAEEVAAVVKDLEQKTAAEEGAATQPALVATGLKAVEEAAAVVSALEEKERITELMGSNATEEDKAGDEENDEEAREVQGAIDRVGQLEGNLKTLMSKLTLKVAGKQTVDQRAASQKAAEEATEHGAAAEGVQQRAVSEAPVLSSFSVPAVNMAAAQSESADLSVEEIGDLEKKAEELEKKAAPEQAAAEWSRPEEEAAEQRVVDDEVQQEVAAVDKALEATEQRAVDDENKAEEAAELMVVDDEETAEGAIEHKAVDDAVQPLVVVQQLVSSEKKAEVAIKQEYGVGANAILGMFKDMQSQIQTLKDNAAEQKAADQKEASAREAAAAQMSRIRAKEVAEAEAAGEAESMMKAAIQARAAAKAEEAAAEAETAAAQAEAKVAAEATAAAQAQAKSAADAEDFFRSEAKAASSAEARSREEATARAVAAARAEAKAGALSAQLEDLSSKWGQRIEEARQKGGEQLAQLREQHGAEMDSLEATHASDLSSLEHVKITLAQGHSDEGEIRRDERLKAKAELESLRERQQEELQRLQQEHVQVLKDTQRRSEMELASLQQIEADEQEQLARLLDSVKSSVLDVMRVVDEATVDKSAQPTSQEQKLEAREDSLPEVEDRLMVESKHASEQQQKVFDLIESFSKRLDNSGMFDALEQKLDAREKSATSIESRVSEETMELAEQRRHVEDALIVARGIEVEKNLDRSVREEKIEERGRGTQDAELVLAGDITAMNEQQRQITDMISQLEDKEKHETPSLRGTTRGEEMIAADFAVEENGSADAPDEEMDLVEERDPAGAPVEQSGAEDTPAEEQDAVDTPVEERDPSNAPVEQSGADDTPAEERGPADAPDEQSGADDTPAEERGPADAPVEQSGADDTPAEKRAAPQNRFYASSANALVEAWNNLHPEDLIPTADAMVKPGVAYRKKAEQKHPAPAGEFLAQKRRVERQTRRRGGQGSQGGE